MKTWSRAKIEYFCGRCHGRIYVGQPVLEFKIGSVRALRRCVECEGPAPPDLPEHVARAPIERVSFAPFKNTAASFTRAKLSDQDWTARILGERE